MKLMITGKITTAPGDSKELNKIMKTTSIENRFWSKVDKSGNCWEWIANTRKGYGSIKIYGKELSAHRVSWEISNGPIPCGLFVLHKCDNPLCVKPDHLFVGTQKDNMVDCKNKGRKKGNPGETNVFAILSESDVIEIRRLSKHLSRTAISAKFNVGIAAISKIILRRTWRHI